MQTEEIFILGYFDKNIIKLKPEEIIYIAIAKRGSNIWVNEEVWKHSNNRTFKSDKKVKELFKILKNHDFVYAHNSYIVNLKYIRRITTDELEMMDGIRLSISRSRFKELKESFIKKYK
ncbi:MAG: LytTR family DNA-binding domain-containing protein [Clostridium sp.]|nr:LytTR family DNA-binding domain-containing protein [Clostridium sp.]